MHIVRSFPYPVREIEHCWIPLSDGCRLAARLWLPDGAGHRPVPAVLEYLPYRKRDGTRERDEPMHRYFAGHGYAAVRVDLRGTGESDGILRDEYLEQELRDGVEVVRWIAEQPWCNGAVGMMGKSWGGFNALQVAARRPPALRAVISVCSTDDRYADDAHYMGGCLLNENLVWGSVLLGVSARPPDPQLVGASWRSTWMKRLEASVLFPALWMRHPTRDAYWRHGSVCEDYAAIACSVYAVGGWADAYTNAVPRLMAGLSGPRRGLVGPWAHVYPHEGTPGPAIGFLQEALRFWGRWLRGVGARDRDEPLYRVWMQEAARPGGSESTRPGRWIAEPAWPSQRVRPRRYAMSEAGLSDAPGRETPLRVSSPQTLGASAGAWCGFGMPGEGPGDQNADDAGSLLFDSPPLRERLEILGAPVVTLELASNRPCALVAVRLCDVFPDGVSTRVTYAVRNLTQRGDPARPEPLVPGRRVSVRVPLNDVAHAFAPGHRLRVAVSSSYWPLVWPSPEPVELVVFAGPSALELPVRQVAPEDARLRRFEEPEIAAPLETVDLHPGGVRRSRERIAATGEWVQTTILDADEHGEPAFQRVEAIDLEIGHSFLERFRIRDDDPLSARAEVCQVVESRRRGWETRIETRARLSSTALAFRLEAALEASEGGRRVFVRTWDERVPRGLL